MAGANNFPKLHNAMWPGLVGKGTGSEPPIDLDTMLDLTSKAEVKGEKFDGIDIFHAAPHTNIDFTDDEVNLKSFDNGMASVSLAGSAVEMAADPAVSTLKPSKVMIGIRPRAFTAESSASKSTIRAQAELIEPMGAETLVHARTKLGGDIRVVVPHAQRIKIGEVLHLKPDPKQTHFFGENGRAVRA